MAGSQILLNLSQFEEFQNCGFKPKSKVYNAALSFLHSLIYEGSKSSHLDFIPRASNFLKLVDNNYLRWLSKLLTAGLVERDHYWVGDGQRGVNGKCYGYRLNPELVSEQLKIIAYNAPKRTKKQGNQPLAVSTRATIRQYRSTISKKEIESGFFNRYVTPEMTRQKIKVNEEIREKSFIWLHPDFEVNGKCYIKKNTSVKVQTAKMYAAAAGKVLIRDGKRFYIEELKKYLTRKRSNLILSYANSFLGIKSRSVYAQIDNTSGRIHSNASNLTSGLLSYFKIRNQRLVSLDLKTSQPNLLAEILIQLRIYIENNLIFTDGFVAARDYAINENRNKTKTRNKEGINKRKETTTTLLFVIFEVLKGSKPFILKHFQAQNFSYEIAKILTPTPKTDFYSKLAGLLNKKTASSTYTRKDGKRIVFEILFSSAENPSTDKAILRKAAPELIQVIDGFKWTMVEYYKQMEREQPDIFSEIIENRKNNRLKRGKETNSKTLGMAALAVWLQSIEAVIMKDTMQNLIDAKLNPVSKHDSFLVPESEAKRAKQIMEETLQKYFIYTRPIIKFERL